MTLAYIGLAYVVALVIAQLGQALA